jgi:hypothetical protein
MSRKQERRPTEKTDNGHQTPDAVPQYDEQENTPEVAAPSAPPAIPDNGPTAQTQQVDRTSPVEAPEKYFKGRFHAKSRPDDEDKVTLGVHNDVSGEVLVIEREKDVVLPERFWDCARNAHYPQFRQLPGQPRKIVGKVLMFPFEILGESTREAFLAQKKEGTDKLKAGLDKELKEGAG